MLLGQLFVPGMSLISISEKYLWRTNLIKEYNNFKYYIGDRVFKDIVVGKDGWLYYSGEMSIRDHQKIQPANMGTIKRLTQNLNKIKDETEQYGGMFLVIIAPDKSTIYPQYMPDEIPVIGEVSSFDRLVEYVDKNSDIQLLDVRPSFAEVSRDAEVYYKTDTHWNCLGAFYASNAILSEVSASYPAIHPYSLDDFSFSSKESLLDIPTMMSWDIREDRMMLIPKFQTEISEVVKKKRISNEISLKVVVNENEGSPDLLVFHDSFYEVCMDGFLQPNFGSIMSTHYRDVRLADYLDIIAAEKPDVVIIEFAERYLTHFYRIISQ
jgi:hypothetical protein